MFSVCFVNVTKLSELKEKKDGSSERIYSILLGPNLLNQSMQEINNLIGKGKKYH